MKQFALFLAITISAGSLFAAPTLNGNTLTFSNTTWWQVEEPWAPGDPGEVLCNSSTHPNDTCELANGTYKWIQGTEVGTITISVQNSDLDVTYYRSSVRVLWQGGTSATQHSIRCASGHLMATACAVTGNRSASDWVLPQWTELNAAGYTCGASSFNQPFTGSQLVEITITWSCLNL